MHKDKKTGFIGGGNMAEAIIKGALAEGIQVVMFIAAALALAGAAVGGLIPRSTDRPG